MTTVLIRRSNYNYDELAGVIFSIMNALIGDRDMQGMRVVIKPNLLAPAPPDKALVTHPLIIKAVAEYVINKGGRPQISDSPAVGSFEKILKESGIRNALNGLDVQYREFKESVAVEIGEPFRKIQIAEDAVNADLLINLPKLKTHSQMLLTLGIKNLFGCVVGMKKPEWHLRTGVDRELFATLLVKIWNALKPSVTILDGILAMEGDGPGKGGTPRELGIIMGSSNAAAIDSTVCRMLRLDPDILLTNKIARTSGLLEKDIYVDGEVEVIRDFDLPEISPIVFGPERMHGFMRRHLVQRPVCDSLTCKLCGECWKYCPAQAITHDKEKIYFDYDKCIRCYCCIEVCPHGALRSKESHLGKITRKILKI